MFLVAERLTWDDKLVSAREKDVNEELNWAVNYELDILDPCVEDPEQVIGGKKSRFNKFHPYQNEYEMKLALTFIFMTQDMTETTWALWIGTQMHLQDMLDDKERDNLQSVSGKSTSPQRRRETSRTTFAQQQTPEAIDTIDLTGSPEPASNVLDQKPYGLSTPPLSLPNVAHGSLKPQTIKLEAAQSEEITTSSLAPPPATGNPISPKRIQSYKSLQDFYSLLDKIERTSYVGALFLEAYAEKLRDDMCKDCWLKHNINLDVF
ncbi:hypothetical protein BDU57DRAFT_459317 [Ampelomyces quisqualis]|uniref:Uncharacterized protein n=1 Tax=Ampelomyces quisqualis TaxID=50730 RepID=A0A6A5QD33_AMPQU|nr:hypothetical protein BDU57DRAFT_459317 [Ampelomyces quisqualis]